MIADEWVIIPMFLNFLLINLAYPAGAKLIDPYPWYKNWVPGPDKLTLVFS